MSHFIDNVIYMIIPAVDVTEEMKNNMKKSFHTVFNFQRSNNDQTKYVFKVKTPVSSVFTGYQWYNRDEILVELKNAEWIE